MVKQTIKSSFFWRWIALSLILHLLAACLSSGFYHSDEHFQVLEFLGWKLGITPAANLPLEFSEQMRPWLEPGLFYAIAKAGMSVGLPPVASAPFGWSLAFRILSALMGWLGLLGSALCLRFWAKESAHPERFEKVALLAICLLWCLPAFNARLSSENWGGASFALGLSVILLNRVYHQSRAGLLFSLAAGALMGMAFEFRYQMGIMIAGAALWLALRARLHWKDLAALSFGVLFSIGLASWIDAWGYGHWVNAPWNYVNFNLIQGKVSVVDTDPWWDLFRRALTETWPPLGFLLLLSFPIAWIAYPFQVLTWSTAPFFLIHAAIGHKELRFLFPMLFAAPIMLAFADDALLKRIRSPFQPFFKKLIGFLFIWNLVALIVTTTVPAWMPIRFLERLWDFQKARDEAPITIYWKSKDPYDVSGSPMSFYRPQGITLIHFDQDSELESRLAGNGALWLFHDGFSLVESPALANSCRLEFQAFPSWVSRAADSLHLLRFFKHVTNYSLYRCEVSKNGGV